MTTPTPGDTVAAALRHLLAEIPPLLCKAAPVLLVPLALRRPLGRLGSLPPPLGSRGCHRPHGPVARVAGAPHRHLRHRPCRRLCPAPGRLPPRRRMAQGQGGLRGGGRRRLPHLLPGAPAQLTCPLADIGARGLGVRRSSPSARTAPAPFDGRRSGFPVRRRARPFPPAARIADEPLSGAQRRPRGAGPCPRRRHFPPGSTTPCLPDAPTPERYIVVDIEADGPIPGPHSLLSIGAVACTPEGDALGTWYANLKTLPGAAPHPETQRFWDQNPDAWALARARAAAAAGRGHGAVPRLAAPSHRQLPAPPGARCRPGRVRRHVGPLVRVAVPRRRADAEHQPRPQVGRGGHPGRPVAFRPPDPPGPGAPPAGARTTPSTTRSATPTRSAACARWQGAGGDAARDPPG